MLSYFFFLKQSIKEDSVRWQYVQCVASTEYRAIISVTQTKSIQAKPAENQDPDKTGHEKEACLHQVPAFWKNTEGCLV
jgi:hypothetical protein